MTHIQNPHQSKRRREIYNINRNAPSAIDQDHNILPTVHNVKLLQDDIYFSD